MGISGISIVSLISAITALVASVLSPFVTLNTAKRQINASVISANRTRWLETLRDQIASFVSQLAAVRILLVGQANCDAAAHRDPRAMADRIQQITLTTAKIRLMLNTVEPDHVELLNTIQSVIQFLRHTDDVNAIEQEVDAVIDRILNQSQPMLKREWIRVKRGT